MRLLPHRRRTRLVAGATALLAALVLVLGISAATASARRPQLGRPGSLATSTFALGVDRITITYPSLWEVRPDTSDSTSFTNSVVFLASQPLRDPCTITHGSSPGPIESKVCGYAVEKLEPRGVYVEWLEGGGPPGPRSRPGEPETTTTEPGTQISVNGRNSWIKTQKPGECSYIGGDETITANIGPHTDYWEMQACIRGPGIGTSFAAVLALLRSARFSRP